MTDASERARRVMKRWIYHPEQDLLPNEEESLVAAITAALEAHAAEARADYVPKDWLGLMHILDDIYPEDIFPTLPDNEKRDIGPRLVSLLRYLDRERARAVSMATDVQTQTAALRIEQDRVRELEDYAEKAVPRQAELLETRRERDEARAKLQTYADAGYESGHAAGWRAGRDAAVYLVQAYGHAMDTGTEGTIEQLEQAIRALEPSGGCACDMAGGVHLRDCPHRPGGGE